MNEAPEGVNRVLYVVLVLLLLAMVFTALSVATAGTGM